MVVLVHTGSNGGICRRLLSEYSTLIAVQPLGIVFHKSSCCLMVLSTPIHQFCSPLQLMSSHVELLEINTVAHSS